MILLAGLSFLSFSFLLSVSHSPTHSPTTKHIQSVPGNITVIYYTLTCLAWDRAAPFLALLSFSPCSFLGACLVPLSFGKSHTRLSSDNRYPHFLFPFSFPFFFFFYPLSLTARFPVWRVSLWTRHFNHHHPPAPFSNALVPFVLILRPNPRSFRYRLHLDYTIYRKKPENIIKVQSPRETPSTSPATSTNRQAYNYRPSSYKFNASTTRACSTSRKPVAISKGEAFCEVDCK